MKCFYEKIHIKKFPKKNLKLLESFNPCIIEKENKELIKEVA